MLIPWANSLMVSSYMVFALVASQVFLTWVPSDIIRILLQDIDKKVMCSVLTSLVLLSSWCTR